MYNYFNNKKIMIIVPHQDDEINIVGGLLVSECFSPEKVQIVYTTNGDFLCNYKARYRESFKLAKKLGIPKTNLIFMGYADQHIKEENHIYTTHSPDVFSSLKGDSKTFSSYVKEYHYSKYGEHAEFNQENFCQDLFDIIIENKPEIIFTVDLDSHPDHRATAVAFDKAMGRVLKQESSYRPVVYKAFAYPTAYKGIEDYDDQKPTAFNTEPHSLCKLQNPYYTWEERTRFQTRYPRLLFINPVYQLLKIYRSQLIIKHAKQIINNDMIYWKRRTDNLAITSKITATSGNVEYINDFVTIDFDKLTKGHQEKPTLKNVAWIPSKTDAKKEIQIEFPESTGISELNIYQNTFDDSHIETIQIMLDNEKRIIKLDKKTKINVKNKKIKKIKIKIVEYKGENIGFTEIEIFKVNNRSDYYNKEDKESQCMKRNRILNTTINIINKLTLIIDIFVSRVYNKIDRIQKRL